jgi:glycosyltransferase involved in cell wall biosynthesis
MSLNRLNNIAIKGATFLNKLMPKIDIKIEFRAKASFKKNVFNTSHRKGKVLISYITTPFTKGLVNSHTNILECYTAAQIFSDLGYMVDVVDYFDDSIIKFEDYDVIYGFGDVYEKSFLNTQFKGKRILYSPGCNTVYSNIVSCKRIHELKPKFGYYPVNLSRVTNNAWPLQKYLSDAIIVLGNEFVKETYQKENQAMNCIAINGFGMEHKEAKVTLQKFNDKKYNIVWIGSKGSVHKGLHIVLELVKNNPKVVLHILGFDKNREPEFETAFSSIMHDPRIINHGFIDVSTPKFHEIISSCGAIFFPSASEGSAPAVITATNFGLIPIITKECGLDFDSNEFITEAENSEISAAWHNYLNSSEEILEQKSIAIQKISRERYSFTQYKINLQKILSALLN